MRENINFIRPTGRWVPYCPFPSWIGLNLKLGTLATKPKLKVEQDKIVKLQTCDLSYFLGESFFGDYGFQNIFVYQPSLRTLQLKKDNGN